MAMFARATKTKAKLRLALAGPAGSGKTFTALTIAAALAAMEGGAVAAIDTENGSASKYADIFSFDAAGLTASSGFSPERYLELLHGAEQAGYPVIVIDSLSHEWAGHDGILQAVDQEAARVSGNKFVAWGKVTPRHDKLVRAIVESPAHIICTLRAKMEYVQEKNDRGRTEIRAVGMKPIQRDELEYEFDVYGLLDQDNRLIVRKSRCPDLSGAVVDKPGLDVANTLIRWLNSGEAAVVAEPSQDNVTPIRPESESDTIIRTGAQGVSLMERAAARRVIVDGRVVKDNTGNLELTEDEKERARAMVGDEEIPSHYLCVDCSKPYLQDEVVKLRKSAKGGRDTEVTYRELEPISIQRFRKPLCGDCYDKARWPQAQAANEAI